LALLGTGLVNDVGSVKITWILLVGSEASERQLVSPTDVATLKLFLNEDVVL
jgi:hypothetical protein